MKIHFVDTNIDVIKALKKVFYGIEDVEFLNDDILNVAKEAIVSPANSYGFMDGGIDKDYINYFGISIQNKVQERLNLLGGFVRVGSGFTIETGNKQIPYLIFAPTMELPDRVNPQNCYFAMRAILREVEKGFNKFHNIYCPGLCTGVGEVEYESAAIEIYKAYMDWFENV